MEQIKKWITVYFKDSRIFRLDFDKDVMVGVFFPSGHICDRCEMGNRVHKTKSLSINSVISVSLGAPGSPAEHTKPHGRIVSGRADISDFNLPSEYRLLSSPWSPLACTAATRKAGRNHSGWIKTARPNPTLNYMNETGTSRVKERKSELTCASHRILRLRVNPEMALSARSAFPRGMEFPIGTAVLSSIVQEHREETEASLLAQRAGPNSSKKKMLRRSHNSLSLPVFVLTC